MSVISFRFHLLLILICVSAARAEELGQHPEFNAKVLPYINNYCVECHGPETMEGEFRIDQLSSAVGIKETARWAEVMERISSGEMPPEDYKNSPTAEQGANVVQWLSQRIQEGKALRLAKRDKVSFYRLTRDEYVNAVNDLLGVQFDAKDPGGFTEDPRWHGFERVGSVLTLSPSHIEKYFKAAETILDEAYPNKTVEPITIEKLAGDPQRVQQPYKSLLEAKGLLDKVRFDCWPGDKFRYGSPGRLPAAGIYEVTVQLSGLKPAEGPSPRLLVYHEKLDRVIYEGDVTAPEDKPTTVTFKTHLSADHHNVLMINNLAGPSNLPRSGRHGRKPFVSIAEGRIPWQMKLTDEEGNALYPFLIFDKVTWHGPIVTPEQQALRDSYMPKTDGDFEELKQCFTRMATRAFRRPLFPNEVDKYVSIAKSEFTNGTLWRDSVKTGMLAILCSKSFLFIVEGDAEESRPAINDYELATRLSFLLWSGMPDDELLTLAGNHKLHDKQILKAQINRMLSSPKATQFLESFPKQWLQLHKVGMFPPDAKLYPEYDKHLELSMIRETTSFFKELVQNNLPLQEVISSNWTMLNARLAKHYGIEGVKSDKFQRVSLTPELHRGGLLTHAATLSLTSDGTRHRPVHRGVWLSESLLGKTPPPPPANVDAIEPNPVDAPKATLRMKLEAHKANPNCASCHRKIDPLGLAFENFNAIGKWRTTELVKTGTGANPPVDPSGELADGRTFSNATEFKQLLLDDMDTIATAFIEKLATYGLRRTITIDDHADINNIALSAKEHNYQVKTIIEEFVLSDLFKKR